MLFDDQQRQLGWTEMLGELLAGVEADDEHCRRPMRRHVGHHPPVGIERCADRYWADTGCGRAHLIWMVGASCDGCTVAVSGGS